MWVFNVFLKVYERNKITIEGNDIHSTEKNNRFIVVKIVLPHLGNKIYDWISLKNGHIFKI